MPSAHAANWFAAVAVAFIYYRRSLWFSLPMAIVVSISRIYNGACGRECDGRVERQGRREWWVQLENAEGVVGWTDEADAFGNKDALGGPWQGQVPAAAKPVRRPHPRS